MISEIELSRHCYIRTLQRARQIAASDRNILTKQIRYDNVHTTLSAFVASSHGWDDRYRTSATLDEDEGLIVDYSCTCPAFFKEDGMCKHSTALVLSYLAEPKKFIGYQTKRVAVTSPGIAALMERTKQAAFADEQGLVNLEPTIDYGFQNWSAHFKIAGPGGSYVMKSITDFVRRMRSGERFSYGKKLTFTHAPAMLSDHARLIASFLEKAVSLREQVNGAAFWRYRGRDEVDRDLDLSDSELIELLDILAGTPFTVRGTDYGTRSIMKARIEKADPSVNIELNPSSKDGYDIVATEEIPFVSQGDRMYALQGDILYNCSPEFAHNAHFLRSLYQSDDGSLFVSKNDMPLFCATILPDIEQRLHVSIPTKVNEYRPVPCKLEFYFDKTKKGVSCDARAVYNKQSYPLFAVLQPNSLKTPSTSPSKTKNLVTHDNETPGGSLRDELLESRAKTLVEEYFDLPIPFIEMANDEAVAELIFGGLVRFQALGTVFSTPAFDRLLSDKQPRVTMGLSLAGNLVNLTVSTDDLPSAELGALLSSYRKHKRYHRLRSGAFLNLEGYDLAQLDRIVADFGITAAQLSSKMVALPAYQAIYLDEQLNDADKDESFLHYVENFRSIDEKSYQVPKPLIQTLRPYQKKGFEWMSALCDAGFHGILADEMGLGKSAQLISFLLSRRTEAKKVGPSLVVCPASLVYNWMAEFDRFAPGLEIRAVAGTKHERAHMRKGECDVMITSYDLMRIDAEDYAQQTFYCCALDEAQYIKNHATKTARSIKRLQAQHRFALTGTPMENRPSELWSIFDFLLPGLLGTYMRFRERFELPVLGNDTEAVKRLQTLVGPFMLRRCKSDVLRDLPDKLESVVHVNLEGEQHRLYAASEQLLRTSLTEQRSNRKGKNMEAEKAPVEVLAELTRLRQLCCDPHLLYDNYTGPAAKLDAIVELVESAMDAGEKTLVFSQFTSFLSRIADRLNKLDAPYYTITGATPKKKRLDLVNAFNADDTPVFLVSLKAGGTGLNLTGASVVIHADPWWNAAAQNQATDRAHRIGQDKVVSVHRVIAADTIEERILRLQEQKNDLANQLIGAGGVSLSTLSKEDLIELLAG